MKKLFVILLGVFALGAATPAQAQVKFGVKGGLNVTNMTFTKDILMPPTRLVSLLVLW